MSPSKNKPPQKGPLKNVSPAGAYFRNFTVPSEETVFCNPRLAIMPGTFFEDLRPFLSVSQMFYTLKRKCTRIGLCNSSETFSEI